jgi:hypothetical protein
LSLKVLLKLTLLHFFLQKLKCDSHEQGEGRSKRCSSHRADNSVIPEDSSSKEWSFSFRIGEACGANAGKICHTGRGFAMSFQILFLHFFGIFKLLSLWKYILNLYLGLFRGQWKHKDFSAEDYSRLYPIHEAFSD